MSASATQVRLGIDFGTSNTIAVMERPGLPATPLLFDGSPVLPSAVFATEGKLLVGRDAERAAMSDPASFEPHPKRCIADTTVLLGQREFKAVDLAAAVLARVAAEAQRVAGVMPGTVVLTHPAGWANERLKLLSTAAYQAGLPPPRFASEPVAAATHFVTHLGHTFPDGSHIVVYDLGGGTFDVSVVRMAGDNLEVTATGGLPDVGGVDIDFAIVRHLEQTYPGEDGQWRRLREPESPADRRHRRGLWRDVRDAKEILSRESNSALFIPVLDVDAHLTREELDTLARPLLAETVALTMDVLAGAKIGMDKVAGLFLVGGASRMPLSSTLLMRETRIAPTVLEQPELVVASGAIDAPGRESHASPDGSPTMIAALPPVVVEPPPRPVYRGVAKVPTRPAITPESEVLAQAVVSVDLPAEAAAPQVAAAPPVPQQRPAEADGTAAPLASATPSIPQPHPADATGTAAPLAAAMAAPSGVATAEPEAALRQPSPTAAVPAAQAGPPSTAIPATAPPPPAPMTTTPAEGPVLALAHAREGRLAVARPDSVTVSTVSGTAPSVVLRDHDGPVVGVRWSTEAPGLLAVGSGNTVTLWRDNDNAFASTRTIACPDEVKQLSWSATGLATATGTEILVWDPATGECSRTWRFSSGPEGEPLRALVWNHAGDRLAAGGSLGTIKVWRTGEDSPSTVLNCAPVGVRTLAFSPDGDWLVSGDAAGGLRIWRLSDSSDQHLKQAHEAAVQTVAWSPDGKLIASGGIDSRVRLWDAGSGREHRVGEGHTGTVNTLCWSTDGNRVISGSSDGTVRQWTAATGAELPERLG
ncbi:Hsp70 family protein [Stackebrandtia nassauensis]|uniref:WD-40 repeat protein n=1 Tax=Stackebrandtia nassauensis (strain DSM 44728 / CIP 108903 / NRRL B-16338 / NBRC 102104 / LLR-40K-21) TaxID=446470 RepID=D3QAK2_STANL|nr:Hsp70 family protein [Stackebrandtia nassauensis]ADD42785.1 WD-40 repeat protein [Stackebrandtia nassauensis DSM 44728]